MSEKPQKRLVNRRQYAAVMGEEYSLGIFAWLQMGGGSAGFVLLVVLLVRSYIVSRTSGLSELALEATMVLSAAIGLTSLLLLISSISLFKKARRIDPVVLLTARNAHLLPPEESLVRASDLSPSYQQAELLRAAGQGKETPVAELLRAAQESNKK